MDGCVFLFVLLIVRRRFALGLNDLGCAILHLFRVEVGMLILMGMNEGVRPWFMML